ncbi:CID domain-containing protein [Meloidogyne graminicola]|uniref:CID domain-containing protein n=1 Tax=Meloidogyne graminicola TaxID=189291 RepID=A0A8S9ZLV2_9BILA|nr:CID domain-containing protein [Meloidogyne graminicola]
MVPPPTEDTMRKRLMSVNSTQESVQTCSKWLLHHRESIDKIANIWMEIYKQSKANDKLRTALIYVLNDVVQKAASKRDINVTLTFHPHLINATTISSLNVKKAISRCVEVFGERNVYPAHIIEEMKTALVSRIATEKDESQNATEIDFQKLIRSIESFYKNEMLTEKAREILSRSSFNFKESVQGRVKDRNEGIKALADMDSSRQKLISFLDTVEKHKQKGLQLHEMMKRTENTFNLQLRDVTVINDAYERFAEGIKKTKQQLESLTTSGGMLGESPPRDAPSPTLGDDPFIHGVDGEELAGGGDDMEMDDEDRPGPSSSRCFLKTANEYTRISTIPPIGHHISPSIPPLNAQFIQLPVSTNIPRSVQQLWIHVKQDFFQQQQQSSFQSSPSVPPPPGASPPPPTFFQQTNGSNIEQQQTTHHLSSPPTIFNPINPPPLIPRNSKFANSFNSSQPSLHSPPPNFVLPRLD